MSTLNLDSLELVSTLRTAPLNGSPSSEDYNDCQREFLADMASLAGFINDKLLPVLNALSDGALLPADSPVGLEGRTLYSDTSDQSQLFFDAVQSVPLTVADSLRLVNGMLTTYRQQLTDMGVEVASVQARLASTSQNDIALALQNLTSSLNQVTTTQASQASQITDLNNALGKFKARRVSTGTVTASSYADVAITWDTPYVDNNYSVALAIQRGAIADLLTVEGFTYQANGAGITVRVHNADVSSKTGTINAIASHDYLDGSNGAASLLVATVTSNTSLAWGTNETVYVDATSGPVTITLPTAVGHTGGKMRIKRTSSAAYNVTIATTSSQTIDGNSTYTLANQGQIVVVESDGTNWQIWSAN